MRKFMGDLRTVPTCQFAGLRAAGGRGGEGERAARSEAAAGAHNALHCGMHRCTLRAPRLAPRASLQHAPGQRRRFVFLCLQ